MKVTASTLLINILTDEYPVNLLKVRQDNPDVSFAAEPDISTIHDLGYDVVQPTDRPAGDVITEATPELIEGVYKQKWTVRSYTPEELADTLSLQKTTLTSQCNSLRDSKLAEGVQFDFGGEFGVLTVQLGPLDCTNIVGVRVTADALIAAGAGESVMGFRTMENTIAMVPATTIVAMSNAAFQRVNAVYTASWALKDAIRAATTIAELPVIPAELDV